MSHLLTSYKGNFARERSHKIWQNADLIGAINDPSGGLLVHDDFHELLTGRHVVTNATAGTFQLADGRHGIARLDAASTTANQGVEVQRLTANGGEIFKPEASSRIYFEARVRLNESPATSPPDMFIGLSERDTTIIASGANSSANHIGFELINEDATLDFVTENAGTRATYADVKTLAEDTWYKLGFVVDGTGTVKYYVDGELIGTVTGSTSIPVLEMAPSLACKVSGTAAAQPELDIDWWTIYQSDRS